MRLGYQAFNYKINANGIQLIILHTYISEYNELLSSNYVISQDIMQMTPNNNNDNNNEWHCMNTTQSIRQSYYRLIYSRQTGHLLSLQHRSSQMLERRSDSRARASKYLVTYDC